MKNPRILIMAGGTGGHVFPALAVAQSLINQGWEAHWLGTKAGMEAEIVPKSRIPLHFITIAGLRKKSVFTWIVAPFKLGIALFQSLKTILSIQPAVVLGMGGFVAGPGGVAAWILRKPLIIHEQNAIVGLTNAGLAYLATTVLEAFPGAFKAKHRAIPTGNPVRADLLEMDSPKIRFQNRAPQRAIRLLILGGSRGAVALNTLCPEAIAKIPLDLRPELWHQTGGGQAETTRQHYQRLNVQAKVEPFIQNMKEAYAWADLVLCRSGALTVAELASVGVASILVPFPYAVDDHQTFNGRFLEKAGAAILIQQKDVTSEKLVNLLQDFTNHPEKLFMMAEKAYQMASRDALSKVVNFCKEYGK